MQKIHLVLDYRLQAAFILQVHQQKIIHSAARLIYAKKQVTRPVLEKKAVTGEGVFRAGNSRFGSVSGLDRLLVEFSN